MSTNRLLALVIAIALAVVAALTIREGLATRAGASSDSALSNYVQPHRSGPLAAPLISIVTTDYWARHPELNRSAAQ